MPKIEPFKDIKERPIELFPSLPPESTVQQTPEILVEEVRDRLFRGRVPANPPERKFVNV